MMSDISKDFLDFLEAPSFIKKTIIDYHVNTAKAAKIGKIRCEQDRCSNYKRRDNDGYGWREVGCGISGTDKPLKEHEFCPYKRVKPFRYNPFPIKKDPSLKGERVDLIFECFVKAFIEEFPYGKEIKEKVDKVYEDWEVKE